MKKDPLQKLAQLIRYYILLSTTTAGSGHPSSSLSATDLMTALFFGGLASPNPRSNRGEGGYFHFDFDNPLNPANDRLIFSKGHASPLFYALYLAAGIITPEEMMTLRQFDSRLEGHPTPRFPYTEAATGSLGQGLSVGVGMGMAIRKNYELGIRNKESRKKNINIHNSGFIIHNSIPKVFVLLGDGEMAEGSTWEAINLASYYKLDNLIAIVDVNRLGQSQETMLGWKTKEYEKRFRAFGWSTLVIDGHDYEEIRKALYKAIYKATPYKGRQIGPFVIIAKTIKGKGVSFLENKEGWHGKPVPKEDLAKALEELGEVDLTVRGKVEKPILVVSDWSFVVGQRSKTKDQRLTAYSLGDQIATRKAFGLALSRLGEAYPRIVSLDAEVKNSTYSEIFKEKFPERFFEMFIAEQNMVGAAVGFARLGYIPFVSSFACFLTRAYDQIRMAALSGANVKFVGSHAGVSIGEDGPSQMGLEDLSMFRAVYDSVVLYPADAVATEKLVEEMFKHKGICYLRTTRPATPVIYDNSEEFPIGGSKLHWFPPKSLKSPKLLKQKVVIIGAGITLFEALAAQKELAKEGIEAIVVDCYSIKPIDEKGLQKIVSDLRKKRNTPIQIITVEDHWFEGGLGDEVLNVFADEKIVKIHKLAVTKMPRSGKPQELLDYEGISAKAIISKVLSLKRPK